MRILPLILACSILGAAEQAPPSEQREVCFVLDTTGSMGGLLEGAKQRIWAIVNQLTIAEPGKPRPQLRLGLVAYRDRGDAYVTQVTGLSNDLDAIYLKLSALQAGGGGDTPESVNQGLSEAVGNLAWSADRNVVKTIFLVGDCPPHMDYIDDVKYPETCTSAVSKGIVINALQCGSDRLTTPIWQDIAKRSEGSYAGIPQDGGVNNQATPYDNEVAILNTAFANTAIAYGTNRQREEVGAKVAAQRLAPVAASAERASYLANDRADTGGSAPSKAVLGRGDLISDVAEKKVDLATLPKDQLPEELQKLDADALEIELIARRHKREVLAKQLDGKVAERAAWLRAQADTKPTDGFDSQVADMVRTQAAKETAK